MYHPITRKPYEFVLVVLDLSPEGKKVFNVKTINSLSGIKVKTPRNKGIPGQCHRCQMYGHFARNYHARHRCMKCIGDHETITVLGQKRPKQLTVHPPHDPRVYNCGRSVINRTTLLSSCKLQAKQIPTRYRRWRTK